MTPSRTAPSSGGSGSGIPRRCSSHSMPSVGTCARSWTRVPPRPAGRRRRSRRPRQGWVCSMSMTAAGTTRVSRPSTSTSWRPCSSKGSRRLTGAPARTSSHRAPNTQPAPSAVPNRANTSCGARATVRSAAIVVVCIEVPTRAVGSAGVPLHARLGRRGSRRGGAVDTLRQDRLEEGESIADGAVDVEGVVAVAAVAPLVHQAGGAQDAQGAGDGGAPDGVDAAGDLPDGQLAVLPEHGQDAAADPVGQGVEREVLRLHGPDRITCRRLATYRHGSAGGSPTTAGALGGVVEVDADVVVEPASERL